MSNLQKIFNFNIGILGHVDSGKTSLAKALSTTASTAAFDKNPQSQERGITLDLGFSSFIIDMPTILCNEKDHRFGAYEKLQFTLVDCPGHASLIRTVIGGAQIIDMVLLVVDAVKGVQTQTAECLVLGEVTCPRHMVVVLNKIDVFDDSTRGGQIEKMTKRLQKTLANTSYKDAPIVPVSANENINLNLLIEEIIKGMYFPKRRENGPFLFAVDHCFSIRGQGTIMTGTVLSGAIKVGDQIEIPQLKETKKVKTIQMFRQPVQRAVQGDRIGVCLTQFDAKLFERGLACQSGAVVTAYAAIVDTVRIPYFKQQATNKMKFHVSVGHETVMAKCQFFGCQMDDCGCVLSADENTKDDEEKKYEFNFQQDYLYLESFGEEKDEKANEEILKIPVEKCTHRYALLEFDQPVLCPVNALYIASKLDTDIHSNLCRLAFYGRILSAFTDKNFRQKEVARLRVFKNKTRHGTVDRLHDDYTLIAHGLFKKETNFDAFLGLKVTVGSAQQRGTVDGTFGQSGKIKIRLQERVNADLLESLQNKSGGKKRGKNAADSNAVDEKDVQKMEKENFLVTLAFKRYVFDPQKKMVQ